MLGERVQLQSGKAFWWQRYCRVWGLNSWLSGLNSGIYDLLPPRWIPELWAAEASLVEVR